MKKRIVLFLSFLFLVLLGGITIISFAEGEEVCAEETTDLYQFGALDSGSETSLYSLEFDDLKDQIYADLCQVKPETDVSAYGIGAATVKAAFEAVVNDHPELFYVANKYKYYYLSSSNMVTRIIWEYTEADASIIESMKKEMEDRTSEILALTDDSMTDIEKLMTIHEALILNTSYSTMTDWKNGTGCYTAYCALTEGKAVCQGYVLAFHLLAGRLGIQDTFVASTALNHAWNYVILNGRGYHIDCTWDDTEGKNGEISHRNFLLSDSGIKSTGHSSWDNEILSADDPFFDDYYWRQSAYSNVFVKWDGYWYQIDNVITDFEKLSGVWAEEDFVALYGYKNSEPATVEIPIEEQKWIGENLLEPDFLTDVTSVKFDADVYEIYRGESFYPSYSIKPTGGTHDVWWFSGDETIAEAEEDGKVNGVGIGTTRLYVVVDGVVRGCDVKVAAAPVAVSYQTHVQTYGWQNWVGDGDVSGTSGQAKRLEGIRINVSGNRRLGIEYRTHVQTYGWQDWVANGELSGTTGEAKRLEAIEIRLTGADADIYDVYYRVHAQTYGWLGWAKNGESAGTAGLAKRLEAIEIVVVKKGGSAPGATENCFMQKKPTITYQTHVQTYGWQGWRSNGQLSGTSGQAKRLEAIRIKLNDSDLPGGLLYQTHVQTYGWQNWVSGGQTSGTSGEAKRLEAIRIKLTGQMAEKYDIYYRVHVQTYGWLDWVKNGEAAGTTGQAKRLEAIEIKLVEK